MENTLLQLDPNTQVWFERIEEATSNSRPCPVPPKYFDVLKTWGVVEGCASAAKLSGTGMGIRLLQKKENEAADRQAKTAIRKSSSRRKK